MTLTVQDLVTKLDDFADDAKIKVKRFYLLQETSITRDVVDIKKDDNGNVVLIEEVVSIQRDDEESEDKESEDEGIATNLRGDEDEESEDEESEDEESEDEE